MIFCKEPTCLGFSKQTGLFQLFIRVVCDKGAIMQVVNLFINATESNPVQDLYKMFLKLYFTSKYNVGMWKREFVFQFSVEKPLPNTILCNQTFRLDNQIIVHIQAQSSIQKSPNLEKANSLFSLCVYCALSCYCSIFTVYRVSFLEVQKENNYRKFWITFLGYLY